MVFWTVITTAGLCALGLAGYVRPGAEVACLRDSVEAALPHLQPRVCVNVGGLTFGAARALAAVFAVPAEPRAALQTVRGVNVAVYGPGGTITDQNTDEIIARADRGMTSRKWERAVLVREKDRMVVVYVPRNLRAADHLRACVMVIEPGNIVLVSARANLEPLLELARLNPALTGPVLRPTLHTADGPR